ncbi:MAG: hypothetical protein ABI480_01130 [Chitinophagaceae bacterium]
MKSILLTACLCLAGSLAFSQVCDFYYFRDGKTIELTFYNKKGDESGKSIYKVSDVKKSGSTTSGTIQSEVFDKKGKSIAKATNNIKCNGGELLIDLKMFMSSEQAGQIKADASASDSYLSYPAIMKTGDVLPDGKLHLNIDQNNGMKSVVDIDITERKVGEKETVTTPAGTWECFKITYHSVVKITMMGIGIPIRSDVTEWFAPGFGPVKTESSKGGTTLLTKFQ